MADPLNASLPDSQDTNLDSSFNGLSFREKFIWDWYIRLKAQFVVCNDPVLSKSLDDISNEVNSLWQEIKSSLQIEVQLGPGILVDNSESYFWLIGMPNLPAPELARCRYILREWQKEVSEKMEGKVIRFESKFIPRKVFHLQDFELYTPAKFHVQRPKLETPEEPVLSVVVEKEQKDEEEVHTAQKFKKIKGSNPQEVRRQFLEHNMKDFGSASSSYSSQSSSSRKLRPGKAVLNRLKFDLMYNMDDYVVGYIDRKVGILEKSVNEWGDFGKEELMAYVKNVKDERIVWDRARKIDLVFGARPD